MSTRLTRWCVGCVALGLILMVGCREDDAGEKKDAASADVETVAVKLAAADAYDGATDKIVSKCLACGLKMEGSDKHSVTVEGYAVHLCGPECETKFKEDTTKAILALVVPTK